MRLSRSDQVAKRTPKGLQGAALNASLRKEVEREMGAPEGNLAIVERCAHEHQRLFSCREYGWVGSAHVLTSTQDGVVEHQTQMQSKNGKNLNV